METLFIIQSPIRAEVPSLRPVGILEGSFIQVLGDEPTPGGEQPILRSVQHVTMPAAIPLPHVAKVGLLETHAFQQIGQNTADQQIATLHTHINALKLYLLQMAARGLAEQLVEPPESDRDFVHHVQVLTDLQTLNQAISVMEAGEWIDANVFQLHGARDAAVRFDDIADIQILSVEAGSLRSWLLVKWKEFTDANIHTQLHTLAAATVVATALIGMAHFATQALAATETENPGITLLLPLDDLRNALTLEQIAQERQRYYDPQSSGVKDLQSALTRLEFDTQGIDGKRGPKTRAAERAAAEAWGLDGLDADSIEFRTRLAREIFLRGQITATKP